MLDNLLGCLRVDSVGFLRIYGHLDTLATKVGEISRLEHVMNFFPSREAQSEYKCEEAAGASAEATYQVVEHS